MLEDSLDLFFGVDLDAGERLPPGLVKVIPPSLSATSFAASASDFVRNFSQGATQTYYLCPKTLMDSELATRKFERYSTFQLTMPL